MLPDDALSYIVGGQPVALTRVAGVRLVTPARDEHVAAVAARLARSSRLSIDPAVPQAYLVVRGEAAKMEEMREYRDVGSTRSAFLDPDGLELLLTDEILVCFAGGLSEAARRRIVDYYPCTLAGIDEDVWKLHVQDADDDAPLAIANAMSAEDGVDFAEPNALQRANFLATAVPSDQFFKNQWHLRNTGQGGGKKGADVKALAAWKVTQGDPNVRVVVHDSGVDIDHADLKANIGEGKDFDNGDSDASNDAGPHGTACAGVIAAPRNGKGVVGIAPKCTISPLRAAGAHTWETWKKTFEWAAKKGEVISCSWSISANNTLSAAIRKAVQGGRNGKGIPILCATGNSGVGTISYPASMPETIAVGASSNKDVRSSYSQYGKGIDFVAPSSGGTSGTLRIETTDVMGAAGYSTGDYCKSAGGSGFGGTSSATPLAAGIAALILSTNANLTVAEVRSIMRETCDKIDSSNAGYNSKGWSKEYGYGRVNAGNAVKAAKLAGKGKKGAGPETRR